MKPPLSTLTLPKLLVLTLLVLQFNSSNAVRIVEIDPSEDFHTQITSGTLVDDIFMIPAGTFTLTATLELGRAGQ